MAQRNKHLADELNRAIGNSSDLLPYVSCERDKYNVLYNASVWNANNTAYYDAVYDLLLSWVSTDATVIPLVPQSSETRCQSDRLTG